MYKLFILSLLVAASVEAQENRYLVINQSNTTVFTGSVPINSATDNGRFIIGLSTVPELDSSVLNSNYTHLPLAYSAHFTCLQNGLDKNKTTAYSIANYHTLTLDSAAKEFSNDGNVSGALPIASNDGELKFIKPSYADYVVLPNDRKDFFEFYDHEAKTFSGTTIDLTTYQLSATYFNTQSSDKKNGADIVNHAIYSEATFGSGNKPWMVATAPSKDEAVSLQLNADGNLAWDNDAAAFRIETAQGKIFQMATNIDGGKIGWTHLDGDTHLELSSDIVTATGQFDAEGRISSKVGLFVQDSTVFGLNITSNSIAFQNRFDKTYVPADLSVSIDGKYTESVVLDSKLRGGIVLNTVENEPKNEGGPITFVVNSNIIQRWASTGTVIGSDIMDSSAVLTLISTDRGFLLPRLTDDQILNIPNPSEGLMVYNLDRHNLAIFTGNGWAAPVLEKLTFSKDRLISQ